MTADAKEFFKYEERVADLGLIAAPGAEDLAKKIDEHLVIWAKEAGWKVDSFIIESECPRFSSGDGKGLIKSSIRGDDLYIVADVGKLQLHIQPVRPRELHVAGRPFPEHQAPDPGGVRKAHRISLIMPLLYGSRQHRRNYRESLDCAFALQELQTMGVSNIITFDRARPAHAERRCR